MSKELRTYVEVAKRIVMFTGAGISTDSGVPDFRSPTGIWQKMKPIQFQDFLASEDVRIESWRRKFDLDMGMDDAVPNKGHLVIAELIRSGAATCVITQNIDNLHQDSGIESDCVIELHGNTSFARCLDCASRFELAEIREQFEACQRSLAPRCSNCNGFVKTATISFGQSMPDAEMLLAEKASLDCDLFIAIGSSLKVFPAAGFPILAKRNGAKLIIINREPTELDSIADLVLNEDISSTLAVLTDY